MRPVERASRRRRAAGPSRRARASRCSSSCSSWRSSAVVSAEFAYSMRLEAAAVRAYKNGIIGNHLAEAALEQAIREIVGDAPLVVEEEDGLLTFYGADRRAASRGCPREKAELGAGRYTVPDHRRGGTTQPQHVATGSHRSAAADARSSRRTSATTIVDSIQDWRDPNEEHRLNGAESDDYYLKLPVAVPRAQREHRVDHRAAADQGHHAGDLQRHQGPPGAGRAWSPYAAPVR